MCYHNYTYQLNTNSRPGGNEGRKGRNMFNINDAVGWIGNVAVFIDHKGGYILVDWPFGWKRMHIH